MRPAAKFRRWGEKHEPLAPDPLRQEAVNAAAAAIKPLIGPKCPTGADVLAETVLASFIFARAKQAYSSPEIMQALSSERPWGMVRLIDPAGELQASVASVLPMAGEVASQIDPTGQKLFFEWSRDEIMRLFETVIWAWEESQGRVRPPDAIMPPEYFTATEPAPDREEPRVPLYTPILPASQYRGPIIEDEIPF